MSAELGAPLFAAQSAGVWHGLWDVLVLLAIALVLGALAEQLRQSVIVGYLIAGTLVGPSVLGWIAGQEQLYALSELGVVLLLFAIGLEFSPRRLMRLGSVVLGAGPLQVIATTAAIALGAVACGLSGAEALVVGAMAALSSTACVLRLLTDRAEVESAYGRVATGILLVQDVAVVPLMLLITVLAGGGSIGAIIVKLLLYLLAAAGLIAAFFVVFNLLAPKVLQLPSWRRNRDLPSLLAALMAIGSAWAAEYFGLSPALGAFSAGVLLAVSPFANQIRADVRPLGTVMVTLFFASIGMFGDPVWLLGHLGPVAALVAAIIAVKTIIVALLAWLFGYSFRYALAAGLCLAQVGEFSFVVANIARTAGPEPIMGEETFRGVVSATIITLLLTPYLVAAAPVVGAVVERWLLRAPPWQRRKQKLTAVAEVLAVGNGGSASLRHRGRRVLLVGFGPAGQRVAEGLLDAYRDQLTVVDLNPDNLKVAERYGLPAHLGDATRPEILEHAGIADARVVVITTPAPQTGRQIVHQVRALAPDAMIVARSRYHVFHWELLFAGAQVVVDEEDLVGRRLARVVHQFLHQPLLPG